MRSVAPIIRVLFAALKPELLHMPPMITEDPSGLSSTSETLNMQGLFSPDPENYMDCMPCGQLSAGLNYPQATEVT